MEGGCHCKAIRFITEKDAFWVGACYCIDCRKISGAPYLVWAAYETDAVKILHGNPKKYSSSEQVVRSFCENCSSPFSYQYKNKKLLNMDYGRILISEIYGVSFKCRRD